SAANRIRNPFKHCPGRQSEALFNSLLGPVHANNGLANVPFRPQGKEKGGAIAIAIATTNDAAMRAERHVPLFGKIHSRGWPVISVNRP
ncbi:hypothetical protein, partial [Burkholderia orbicola]|uniref:hypothetical protein n=1 Tax=Burkholderia orbicola TaxID=2978683 RepID=UPI002FE109A1